MTPVKFLLLELCAVVLALLILIFYWTFQSVPDLHDQYPVDIVTQNYGNSSKIEVPQLSDVENSVFYVYTTTIDLKGHLILVSPALMFNKGNDKYSVLTYSNLPAGNYNVIVHLNYALNPIRNAKQSFTLATLSVSGVQNVQPTIKYRYNTRPTGPICTKDSVIDNPPFTRSIELYVNSPRYNGP